MQLDVNTRINDFAIKLANVNGTGSASANSLLMQAIFRMGVPVSGKNLFPSNIQGLPTWYEIRVSKDGYTARPPRIDLAVALNRDQALYVSAPLPQTGRVMVKDEDVCVHCGLCAERCPTAAWDMQKFDLLIPYAGRPVCSST